jgi:hypothetical protein
MARNRGKKALYEVMSKTRVRQGYGKSLEPIRPKKTEESKPAPKTSKAVADWWKRPRIAQYNAGRFEFSIPYQAAIALGLVLVLLLLGSYRLGQNSVVPDQAAIDTRDNEVEKSSEPETTAGLESAKVAQPSPPAGDTASNQDATSTEDVAPDDAEQVEPEEPKGKNVIVLAHSGTYADLVPVVEHFDEHDIALEIVPLENGKYQLRTVERYVRDPAIPGTAGFEAKKEIKRVGALYKGMAPTGYNTFAPHYFSDAYGDNVED